MAAEPTMTNNAHTVRLPWESLTEAFHRLGEVGQTMTSFWHAVDGEGGEPPIDPPTEIGVVTVSLETVDGFTLTWGPVTKADSIFVRIVEQGLSKGTIYELAGTATTIAITGLSKDTTYNFTVAASSAGGNSSTTGTATTLAA